MPSLNGPSVSYPDLNELSESVNADLLEMHNAISGVAAAIEGPVASMPWLYQGIATGLHKIRILNLTIQSEALDILVNFGQGEEGIIVIGLFDSINGYQTKLITGYWPKDVPELDYPARYLLTMIGIKWGIQRRKEVPLLDLKPVSIPKHLVN